MIACSREKLFYGWFTLLIVHISAAYSIVEFNHLAENISNLAIRCSDARKYLSQSMPQIKRLKIKCWQDIQRTMLLNPQIEELIISRPGNMFKMKLKIEWFENWGRGWRTFTFGFGHSFRSIRCNAFGVFGIPFVFCRCEIRKEVQKPEMFDDTMVPGTVGRSDWSHADARKTSNICFGWTLFLDGIL